MADRFLVLAYAQTDDPDRFSGWWALEGAEAVSSLPGAGSARLAEVVEGYPSHALLVDWSDLAAFSPTALFRAFDEAPPAGGTWTGLSPFGAVVLGRQLFPAPTETDPVAESFGPGDHGFIPFTNIDAEVEDGFNEWYNTRHLPAVAGAGLTEGTRFEAFGAAHKYLATYHIDGPETMRSEALQQVRGFDEYTGRAHDLTRLVFQVVG